jgi:hypothetical protein
VKVAVTPPAEPVVAAGDPNWLDYCALHKELKFHTAEVPGMQGNDIGLS